MRTLELQAPAYVISYPNPNVCAQGYQPIVDAGTCHAAAKVLGLQYSSMIDWQYRPNGCFTTRTALSVISGSALFNRNASGESPEGMTICEQLSPWNGVCPPMYTPAMGVPISMLGYVDRSKAWETCNKDTDCCAVSEVDSANHGRSPAKSVTGTQYRLGSCGPWQGFSSWRSCRKDPTASAEGERRRRQRKASKEQMEVKNEGGGEDAGTREQTQHAEGEQTVPQDKANFVRVGARYCSLHVSGHLTAAKSLAECKDKCVASEQCHAIHWHIHPSLPCTLVNQTFTETMGNPDQENGLDFLGAPECWNKQASTKSTKTLQPVSALWKLLQRVYRTTMAKTQ